MAISTSLTFFLCQRVSDHLTAAAGRDGLNAVERGKYSHFIYIVTPSGHRPPSLGTRRRAGSKRSLAAIAPLAMQGTGSDDWDGWWGKGCMHERGGGQLVKLVTLSRRQIKEHNQAPFRGTSHDLPPLLLSRA